MKYSGFLINLLTVVFSSSLALGLLLGAVVLATGGAEGIRAQAEGTPADMGEEHDKTQGY